ncbi:hypothetical protein OIU84_024594 [Salix udensis]|uniref:AMP-dependent synthetase/ligase domain-containing protein n=1 Tax=Salix udensis TaxID=889485 RepID=A0AAD6KHL8_9ROSI|nr:hypothetical protein OIU84_024594 [Salix udensis]
MDLLPKCDANYVPLTPITFLKRANAAYANRTSVIYEGTRFTWSQTYERCCRLADSLRSLKVGKNDVPFGAKVFFVDYQYVELASEALRFTDGAAPSILACIDDIDTPYRCPIRPVGELCIVTGGAYLSTLSQILGREMGNALFIYGLSLCSIAMAGTFTWGVAARGGTNVCSRNTTAKDMYRNIA